MADNEKVLKLDPNNQEAKERKQRLAEDGGNQPLTPPPRRQRLRLPITKRKRRPADAHATAAPNAPFLRG